MSPSQAPHEIAAEAIDLFLEYRDVHGYDEQAAKTAATGEFIDAEPGECEPQTASVPRGGLTVKQWCNLAGINSRNIVTMLQRADEQRIAGYTCDEIIRIFRWHNKRNFLPVLRKFFAESDSR